MRVYCFNQNLRSLSRNFRSRCVSNYGALYRYTKEAIINFFLFENGIFFFFILIFQLPQSYPIHIYKFMALINFLLF